LNNLYSSPKHYIETCDQQQARLKGELEKVQLEHTLKVVRTFTRWLDIRRELGETFTQFECEVMLAGQFKVEGVRPDFIPAAVNLTVDIYLKR
jgi:hypothetical protein